MSRQESQIIKGIALLMMLWLHLFSDVETTLACENLFFIGNVPLATLIARACPPVGFFVFCGGYGLYYTYRKGNDKHYVSRIAKLFIAYWLVLLVCIPLCIYVADAPLQIDAKSIIYNITGVQTSWDAPCWFLFPYALLSLSYPILFRMYDKIRVRYLLPVIFVLNLAIMAALHFWGASIINNRPYLSIPTSYLGFLFLFFCGATVLRCDLISNVRKFISENWGGHFRAFGILTIVILKILLNSAADGGFYTLSIIFMVLVLPLNPTGYIAKFFERVGIHSMNMWMTHYMLYVYILHDQIWGLHYPTLISILLLLLSYLSSILMNSVLKPIYKVLNLS